MRLKRTCLWFHTSKSGMEVFGRVGHFSTEPPQGVAHDEWLKISRDCYASWKSGLVSGELPRKPAFADYAIRDFGKPADFGKPSVSLKYTYYRYWLALTGGYVSEVGGVGMYDVCAGLISSRRVLRGGLQCWRRDDRCCGRCCYVAARQSHRPWQLHSVAAMGNEPPH